MKENRKEVEILYKILSAIYTNPRSQSQILLEARLNSSGSKYFLQKLFASNMIITYGELNMKMYKITKKGQNFCLALREYVVSDLN